MTERELVSKRGNEAKMLLSTTGNGVKRGGERW